MPRIVQHTMAGPTPHALRLPPSYGTDTDGARNAAWSDVAAKLERARNYWLCTTRPDGRPHAVPVWALWVDDVLWFSTDPESTKARNFVRNRNASVHLESGEDVVIVNGEVTHEPWPDDVADAYETKYGYRIDTSNESYGSYVLRPQTAETWDDLRNAVRWTFD